ncbi:hypothetical protein M3B43_10480 [Nesterenkonia massiliensis]|uniref:Uncharacterized protein n=1 Tax=Nesterenkonia massiliensis TaxID=1232429 RepID=A0ABT2HSR4_9MICC|nr:hypothetical protein [Nesterenkonia massiliensis]MCT1607733.1 hypothetical protein [Nesterenkonia massiliensis]
MKHGMVRRVDRYSGLIKKVSALQDNGTRDEADQLASMAREVLRSSGPLLSSSERNFFEKFTNDPYGKLPKKRREEQRPEPTALRPEQRHATSKPTAHRPGPRAKDVRRSRPSKSTSGKTKKPPKTTDQLLNELLRDVDEAMQSSERGVRRAVLRRVSLFLYHLPAARPDTPGVKKLRSFRDRPFRGLPDDPALIEERRAQADRAVQKQREVQAERLRLPPARFNAPKAPTPALLASRGRSDGLTYRTPIFRRTRRDERVKQRNADEFITYRSFLSFPASIGGDVLEVLNNWLAEKGTGLTFGKSATGGSENRFADTLTTESNGCTFHRLRMVEKQSNLNFHTEVVFGFEPDEAWLWVNIWSDGDKPAQAPRFMRQLLDAPGPLSDSPLKFRIIEDAAEADRLYEYLVDPNRQLPAFVAGTDSAPDDSGLEEEFRARAEEWARKTMGLAQFVVLAPEATDRLEERLGESFAPRRWTIRTYEPVLDLGDLNDARRHRFFGTERLSQLEPGAVARRLSTIARGIGNRRGAPRQVRAAQSAFTEAENLRLLQGLTQGHEETRQKLARLESAYSEDEEFGFTQDELRHLTVLKELLDVELFSEDVVESLAHRYVEANEEAIAEIEARLREHTERVEELEVEREVARDDLRDSVLHIAQVEQDAQHLRKQVKWLQTQLADAGEGQVAYSELERFVTRDEAPDNFEELLEMMSEFETRGVYFTGDPDIAEDLDEIDTQGQAVQAAWTSLLTLADYLRAKKEGDFQGDMRTYLEARPSVEYTTVSPKRHAAGESKTTMSQYGEERLLPVPKTVSESGYAYMEAHFRLHPIGIKSPRIHYLDCSSEGKIYVGYIGPHLRTPGTN